MPRWAGIGFSRCLGRAAVTVVSASGQGFESSAKKKTTAATQRVTAVMGRLEWTAESRASAAAACSNEAGNAKQGDCARRRNHRP